MAFGRGLVRLSSKGHVYQTYVDMRHYISDGHILGEAHIFGIRPQFQRVLLDNTGKTGVAYKGYAPNEVRWDEINEFKAGAFRTHAQSLMDMRTNKLKVRALNKVEEFTLQPHDRYGTPRRILYYFTEKWQELVPVAIDDFYWHPSAEFFLELEPQAGSPLFVRYPGREWAMLAQWALAPTERSAACRLAKMDHDYKVYLENERVRAL